MSLRPLASIYECRIFVIVDNNGKPFNVIFGNELNRELSPYILNYNGSHFDANVDDF